MDSISFEEKLVLMEVKMKEFDDIELCRGKDQHLYKQLYNQIKSLIVKEKIEANVKLPPIRDLADKLKVNTVTIVNAYNLLERKGLVYKKVGSGTFVQDLRNKKMQENLFEDDWNKATRENIENSTIENDDSETMISFASSSPTADLFPVDDFKVALNKILDRDKGNAFAYQESQGYYSLRESIKKYINIYGIEADVENIQIISGAQQGIDILSKALIDYGDIVFTESPTYPGAIAVFKSRSAKIVEIPIESDGIDIKSLENKLKSFRPKFIYVMPNFQNPTGYTYSYESKMKLLELASIYNILIIEDDYLSDLSFSNCNNCTLKSLDYEDRVIYIKSFSKIFMPGLRLGFMIIPLSIYNDVLSAKHLSDISTSGLIQRTFELYLREGNWQKNIDSISNVYRKRFDIMVKSLEQFLPEEVKYFMPEGGLNFWLSLPNGYSSNEFYRICVKNKITFVPGSAFYVEEKDNQSFRLSIASLSYEEIQTGTERLSNLLKWYIDTHKDKKMPLDSYRTFL